MAEKDPSLNEKLIQEPISEEEIDELRAEGKGFQHQAARTAAREPVENHRRQSDGEEQAEGSPDEETRRLIAQKAQGGHASQAGHKGLLAHEGHAPDERSGTGDESITEQRRAVARFETEGQPTQMEQDFGEINRNLRGSIHDSENKPSILDPDAEG